MTLIPPAAAPLEGRPACRRRVREALGWTDAEFVIAGIGQMGYDGGQKFLSWAGAIVWEFLPNVRLIFPGVGPNTPNIRTFVAGMRQVDQQPLTEHRFSTADALAAADAAAYVPTRDGGVGGLAAAMAAGLPLVVSRTRDAAWCAPEDTAAIHVTAGDPRALAAAIAKIIDSPELAERLGRGAAAMAAERLAGDAVRRQMEDLWARAPAAEAFGGKCCYNGDPQT